LGFAFKESFEIYRFLTIVLCSDQRREHCPSYPHCGI